MILSENGSDEKIFLFFSLFDNSIPDLVHLSDRWRTTTDENSFSEYIVGKPKKPYCPNLLG
jgi:hypothetical protein